MMDHVARPTLAEGHVHGIQDQLGSQVVGHRPADDPAAPDIQDDRQIEKPRRGRDVGDVGDPQLVRARRLEIAVHQIGRGSGLFVAPCRDRAAAPAAGADQTRRASAGQSACGRAALRRPAARQGHAALRKSAAS
jgi:hypothetical protein